MHTIANELEEITVLYTKLLQKINEEEFIAKPLPDKWSKKEILGHTIDSAQNNIRRFVVAQYEDKPHIVYAQNSWVDAANYQQYDLNDLIMLWSLLNKHICVLLKNIPAGKAEKLCDTGALHTVKWIAADYIKHLKHHLHQVLDLEPVAYP